MTLSTRRLALVRRRQLAQHLRPRARADDWQVLRTMTGPVWRGDRWFETGINGYLFDGGASWADPLPGWYGYIVSPGTLTDAPTATYMSSRHPNSVSSVNEAAYVAYKANWANEGWLTGDLVRGWIILDVIPNDTPPARWGRRWWGLVHPFMRILGTW